MARFLNWQRIFCVLIFTAISMTVLAIQPSASSYSFDSPAQQQRFQALTEQLRCLVCQNESLWDSNAPLAKDLRADIYKKIKQGDDDTAIKSYLVDRYGQFILFKPQLNKTTYALWMIPFILLVGGFVIVILMTLHSRGARQK